MSNSMKLSTPDLNSYQTNIDRAEDSSQKEAQTYRTITHSDRLNLIYANKVLQMNKSFISNLYGINYSSV